jgi:hypothetical protein
VVKEQERRRLVSKTILRERYIRYPGFITENIKQDTLSEKLFI